MERRCDLFLIVDGVGLIPNAQSEGTVIFFIFDKRRFDVVPSALLANKVLYPFSALTQLMRIAFQHFTWNIGRVKRTANPGFHSIMGHFSSALHFS